ncbi:unnamed protein product [Ophioblennius macclurei]
MKLSCRPTVFHVFNLTYFPTHIFSVDGQELTPLPSLTRTRGQSVNTQTLWLLSVSTIFSLSFDFLIECYKNQNLKKRRSCSWGLHVLRWWVGCGGRNPPVTPSSVLEYRAPGREACAPLRGDRQHPLAATGPPYIHPRWVQIDGAPRWPWPVLAAAVVLHREVSAEPSDVTAS